MDDENDMADPPEVMMYRDDPDGFSAESLKMSPMEQGDDEFMDGQHRRGRVCCGCCCDHRRAVIILSFLNIIFCFISIIKRSGEVNDGSMKVYDDDAVNSEISSIVKDHMVTFVRLSIFHLIFSCVGVLGALKFDNIMVRLK